MSTWLRCLISKMEIGLKAKPEAMESFLLSLILSDLEFLYVQIFDTQLHFLLKMKVASKKGLDFSKAVLLSEEKHISGKAFNIPQDEFVKIREKSHFIESKFSKYVEKYVKAFTKGDKNILNSNVYRYTTLVNYHTELGL
ncbi:hypothetical protein [Vibrio campbellii]|uniref:hypothetical protein n=1 Tax=Vibrio campbellii TaxID=680 RepID=UPI001C6136E2|nr:hypothetical protein [Vibrio campbellii]